MRQPAFIGKGELQFISVKRVVSTAQNRQPFPYVHFRKVLESAFDLQLLVFQLLIVGNVLPPTATA